MLNGGAEFVDEAIAFDNVTIRAEIDGIDGGADGGNTGDENENRLRGNFLAIPQELHSIHVGHANVRDDNVEHLRGQATLGRFSAGGHVDFMALFTEAYFEQFADRTLIINDKQLSHTWDYTFPAGRASSTATASD